MRTVFRGDAVELADCEGKRDDVCNVPVDQSVLFLFLCRKHPLMRSAKAAPWVAGKNVLVMDDAKGERDSVD